MKQDILSTYTLTDFQLVITDESSKGPSYFPVQY